MEDKNYLQGIDWSQYNQGPKLPHQMTPTEFRSHPFIVHHGTTMDYPANEITANYSTRSSEVNNLVFAGDRAQAADRAGMGSEFIRRFSGGNIHHYWAVPSQVETEKVFYDDDVPDYHFQQINEENDGFAEKVTSSSVSRRGAQFGYYRNAFEGSGKNDSIDPPGRAALYRLGHLSVAGYPQALKTHSQFVEHAIREGKHDEVPAETMGHYIAGTLDTTKVSKQEWRRHRLGYSDVISPHIDYKDPVFDVTLANRFRGRETNKDLRMASEQAPERYTTEDSEFYRNRQPIDIANIRDLVNNGYARRVADNYRKLNL